MNGETIIITVRGVEGLDDLGVRCSSWQGLYGCVRVYAGRRIACESHRQVQVTT